MGKYEDDSFLKLEKDVVLSNDVNREKYKAKFENSEKEIEKQWIDVENGILKR